MTTNFVHLHVHSEYSLADGIVRLGPLAARAAHYRQPAVALTDLANVHGMIKFYRACLACGVKPLVGCDVWVENPLLPEQVERMIVLCRDHQGYRNLSKLVSDAYLRGQRKGKVVITWADLQAHSDGVLALLDDQQGALANPRLAAKRLDDQLIAHYQQLFGDRLYFQLSRVGYAGEADYIRRAVALAAAHGVGLVATNRVQFLQPEEFDAHEIRVCINDGRVLQDNRRPRRFTAQQYFRNSDEMVALFADLPEAIDNTVQVAQRCNLFFDFDQNFLPAYPDAGDESVDQILRRQAQTGLCARLGVDRLTADDGRALIGQDYIARLDLELGIISQMGYPGYFLIVADFIRWARANHIPVGPGRGSGVGSLVAWATGITELDPLRYGLLFERFLHPERVSLPDFDIDFCVEGRDRVIEYVAERYGRDQVAQVITFGTMAAKAVVRDVGRVMGLPYGFVDQVAKMIPTTLGITLQEALKGEEALRKRYQEEDDIQELIDNAMQLEGIARNAGKHAGGVVIAPKALTEYTPLYADTHLSQAITQLDKDDLEAIGLVKFDFLGLRTLTIIDGAVTLINRRRALEQQPLLDMKAVPLDDPDTFKLIQSGRTTAIFQLESRGMRELIVNLQPDKFDDMAALVALYRPGPLQSKMDVDFIDRKHGRKAIAYPHPHLAPLLEPTYGVILYQEQVMQIAQVLAGYTLGGADLLRAAMGKKKVAEMHRQRAVFRDGAVARGVKPVVAERIFDLMEKFAGYGFNKSHAVAYALVAYHTAWLKAHHPAAYMAATLSAELHDSDRVMSLLADCAELGLTVKPPDINACAYAFRSVDERTILYGLGAIKGMGKAVGTSIEAERERNGAFHDLFDFCRRLEARIANKRVLEALIKSGAMDEIGTHRAALLAEVGSAMQAADQQQTSQQSGQEDMFGVVKAPTVKPAGQRVEAWSEQQTLAAEKEALGLYLSGHPYNRYRAELAEVANNVGTMDLRTPQSGLFAGLVTALRVINSRRGKMAFVTLDNARVCVEVSLYSEKYKHYRAVLQKGAVLIVYGELSRAEGNDGVLMRADSVVDIEAFRAACLRRIQINLRQAQLDGDSVKNIHRILARHRGGGVEIALRYQSSNGESGRLKPGANWSIHPTEPLIETITRLVGPENLKFHYETKSLRNGQKTKPHPRPRLMVAS